MDRPGLLDWLIAPLTWLERSSGPKRLGLCFLYFLIIVVGGLLGWRWLSLWGLPDIGEPFDEARYGTVDVADADNAMVFYRKAFDSLVSPKKAKPQPVLSGAWEDCDWATTDPAVRLWLEANQKPLALWLEGAARPDSLLIQPQDLDEKSSLDELTYLPMLANLAKLEASRLQGVGNLEGAWSYYRAVLRSTRHVGRHGMSLQRTVGFNMLARATPDLIRWIDDSQMTPELLRQAIRDVEATRKMTPLNSEMIRADYFGVRETIKKVAGKSSRGGSMRGEGLFSRSISGWPIIRQFLGREPERTQRVHRLIVASNLAQCDRPGRDRPKLLSQNPMIYEIDDHTPAAVASIRPQELANWVARSDYNLVVGNAGFQFARIEGESGTFDFLLLRMSERAYTIENGQPPKKYGELLGRYLKSLPEGFEPADPVGPATGSN